MALQTAVRSWCLLYCYYSWLKPPAAPPLTILTQSLREIPRDRGVNSHSEKGRGADCSRTRAWSATCEISLVFFWLNLLTKFNITKYCTFTAKYYLKGGTWKKLPPPLYFHPCPEREKIDRWLCKYLEYEQEKYKLYTHLIMKSVKKKIFLA